MDETLLIYYSNFFFAIFNIKTHLRTIMLTLIVKWHLYCICDIHRLTVISGMWGEGLMLVKVFTSMVLICALWKWPLREGRGGWRGCGGAGVARHFEGLSHARTSNGIAVLWSRIFHLGGWLWNSLHGCNKLNARTQTCRLLKGYSVLLESFWTVLSIGLSSMQGGFGFIYWYYARYCE